MSRLLIKFDTCLTLGPNFNEKTLIDDFLQGVHVMTELADASKAVADVGKDFAEIDFNQPASASAANRSNNLASGRMG